MRQAMMFSKRGTSTADVQTLIDAAIAALPRDPKWRVGAWYDCRHYIGGDSATLPLVANTIYASPILVSYDTPVDRIAISVTVAGAASTVARLMLYRPGTDSLPGALLLDAGTVAVDSTGDKEITIATTLAPGLYWTSIVSSGTPTITCISAGGHRMINGSFTPATGNTQGNPLRANGSTTAPDPWGTPTSFPSNTWVRVALRAA